MRLQPEAYSWLHLLHVYAARRLQRLTSRESIVSPYATDNRLRPTSIVVLSR